MELHAMYGNVGKTGGKEQRELKLSNSIYSQKLHVVELPLYHTQRQSHVQLQPLKVTLGEKWRYREVQGCQTKERRAVWVFEGDRSYCQEKSREKKSAVLKARGVYTRRDGYSQFKGCDAEKISVLSIKDELSTRTRMLQMDFGGLSLESMVQTQTVLESTMG